MGHSITRAVVALSILALALAGCEGQSVGQCFDGQDNDGDGTFDCADPGCAQYCTGDDEVCDPGELQECPCSGGEDGVQECDEDGEGWGDCDCGGGDDDAGDDDAGDDDAGDDDAGDDDGGDDDAGDDDGGDDDMGDDDMGDDDMGDDDMGDDDTSAQHVQYLAGVPSTNPCKECDYTFDITYTTIQQGVSNYALADGIYTFGYDSDNDALGSPQPALVFFYNGSWYWYYYAYPGQGGHTLELAYPSWGQYGYWDVIGNGVSMTGMVVNTQ